MRCVIDAYTIINPGTGYTTPPEIYIDGIAGRAEAIIDDKGFVISIRPTDRTNTYNEIPKVQIIGGGVEDGLNYVVVEVKDLEEFNKIKNYEIVDRILVDNFKPIDIIELIKHNSTHKTIEASGGINASNILEYAKTGIDYVSLGDLTHHVNSIDISLKII